MVQALTKHSGSSSKVLTVTIGGKSTTTRHTPMRNENICLQ